MPRIRNSLTAVEVKQIKEPGLYADRDGLYLRVAAGGSKSWVFRFQKAGERRHMGLGGTKAVSLADARQRAADARQALSKGIDPIEQAKARKRAAVAEKASSMTFAQAARNYIEAHEAGWRSGKHGKQWLATLETHAFPVIGEERVSRIDRKMVVDVLQPIWIERHETARRLRGRIENILDWAHARELRTGDNPARWRGLLEHTLTERPKSAAVRHHPALPYSQIAQFMRSLREQEGTAARALEFVILTASRTSEVLGARWSEINFDEGLWIVPASRIKTQREHRVPLSNQALAILRAQWKTRVSDFIFPGARDQRPLSNMALLVLLRRMKRDELTVHGFRSTFRDWTADCTAYPREVAEMSLAHAIGDKVEAAYRRGDLFEKRRLLMTEWAAYCDRVEPNAKVISLRRKNSSA